MLGIGIRRRPFCAQRELLCVILGGRSARSAPTHTGLPLMRFSSLLTLAALGLAACGPTYVVQSPPGSAPERVPAPPRVEPLGVNIVRPDDGRVLVQTSRPAYVAVFEIVPGRGVSLVYPRPYRPRDVMLTGLNWVDVYWTMGPSYDRRFASNEARYIYAIGSDTPLNISDAAYDRGYLERELGDAFWSASPNVTVRAIARVFVRAQPDEWWGEDMYSMPLTRDPRVTVTIRLARVFCPGGVYFDVRDDLADHIWCPARSSRPGGRPVAMQPDSVFSNGRRIPRHVDPSARTPIFRVPTPTDVGQQQGEPRGTPNFPRREPPNPRMPDVNQPGENHPGQNPPGQQPGQNPPPPYQPPQSQPPQNQPPQTQPQTPPTSQPGQPQPGDQTGGNSGHDNNGRRAHGDPRNADPRGNGNGYGNGGREQPGTQAPVTQPPANTPSQSNPQPQQQGQQQGQSHAPQTQPGNGHQDHGNSNPGNSGNAGNTGNSSDHGNGRGPQNAKPNHDETSAPAPSKPGLSSLLKNRGPQAQKQSEKKPDSDSTAKKKP